MKKLYRKGTVHPSPPLVSDHLSFLPAAILTLAVALSPEEKEVLAYLISCSSSSSFGNHHHHRRSNSGNGNGNSNSFSNSSTTPSSSSRRSSDHPAAFNCYCFSCYMSYWVKWDSSPNRQLIHEIIDAFEDGPSVQSKKEKSRKKDRKKSSKGAAASPVKSHDGQVIPNSSELATDDKGFPESESSVGDVLMSREADGGEAGGNSVVEDEEAGKGTPVRRFVGFLGEKIWGIWN